MINKEEIAIESIKNLELIYFYNLDNSPYIGLNIVYDNGKNLNYDYKYEYFNSFLLKVINTYNIEKDKRNILFLNDESKEAIKKFITNKPLEKEENKNLVTNSIYQNRSLDIKFLNNYIKRTILLFLICMKSNEDIKITDFKGYRDRYIIEYTYCN